MGYTVDLDDYTIGTSPGSISSQPQSQSQFPFPQPQLQSQLQFPLPPESIPIGREFPIETKPPLICSSSIS